MIFKKIVFFVLIFSMLFSTNGCCAQNDPEILFNGVSENCNNDFYIENGVSFIAVRDFCKSVNMDISWNENTKSILMKNDFSNMEITVGKTNSVIDKKTYKKKKAVTLPYAPEIKNDKAYIPLKAVAQALGYSVFWNEEKRAVEVNFTKEKPIIFESNDFFSPIKISIEKNTDFLFENPDSFRIEGARFCAGLCAASYDKDTINNLFDNLGFEHNNYYYENTAEKIATSAFTIAKKNMIRDNVSTDIYIVAIRGTISGEWWSNFDIFKSEDSDENVHYGFSQAADRVFEKIKEDLMKSDAQKKKILVTGHSRGGAVANIAGALLNKSDLIKKEDIFCYTFASPAVYKGNEEKASNIFNYINECDIVTKIPAWDYKRYGNDIFFNAKNNIELQKEFYSECETKLNAISSDNTENFVSILTSLCKKPEDYYKKIYSTGNSQISTYAYLCSGLINILSGKNILGGGAFIFSCINNDSRFSELSVLLSNYFKDTSPYSALSCNHSCLTYYFYTMIQPAP